MTLFAQQIENNLKTIMSQYVQHVLTKFSWSKSICHLFLVISSLLFFDLLYCPQYECVFKEHIVSRVHLGKGSQKFRYRKEYFKNFPVVFVFHPINL